MKKWEMVETCKELSLGRFLSYLVACFQTASYIDGFTREWMPNMPYEQISTQQSFLSMVFSHTWYLMQNLP